MSQMRESESTDTALENNSLQIGNMDFQSSNNKNIGFATHTREDSTDATSWLDSHAASSARLELPNYFQKALLDKTVSVYQEKCLRGTFKTLVLVGPPGAGKTTLAKGFIEWMFRCYKEMNHESAYMLFDHQDVAQHNARKVLLRILRWLVGHEHDLNGRSYGTVQQAFAKYTPQEGHEWLQTASSCVDLLLEAIDPVQRKKRSFCIVLDALDEFSDDGELQVLCDQLARLQHELNLNVVLTTRFPDQRTSKALAQPCVERIAAEAPDILGFATKNFAVSAETVVNSLRPGAKKFESILNTIATASDGIFSSVQLNVGYIASARNADELDQLHSDLEEKRFDHPRRSDTGDLVHSDIDRNLRRVLSNTFELHESQLSESQQQILHIFSCVLFARRPLSVRELWAAVELKLRPNLTKHDKFNRSTELYLKTCGLIAQHDQLLTVHFTHPHLRTYLISKNEWRNQGWRIAQSCVDYMGLPVFRQGWCPWHIYQTTTSVWPFVRYAAAHWHHHYREFENQSHNDEECVRNSQQLFQSTMQFLSANKNVDYVSLVMVQLELLHYPSERPRASSIKGKGKMPTASSTKQPDLWYDSTRSYGLSGLLLASLYGMPRLVTKLLDRASLQQKDQLTIKNETSAYLAAISGDVETLREIIRKGLGTKTLNVRDTEGFPLICRAMLCGNMAIVDELLSKAEYNVDIGATIECEPLDEPYSLPDVGGDAKLVGVANRLRGYSLLHQAAVGGFTSVVDKLLELGARPNVQDAFGMTPLHKAAKYGHLEIVRLLVEKGQVDPVARVSNDQRTALHMASKYNRVEVASYLIARFPDLPSAKTSNDRLAIHHAVMAGSEGIAAMLLETQSKRPGLISQLGNLHMQDGKSASVGRRYTISLHTRSKENLSALSPSMNKLKHRNTASEEESATPRYNLRSAKRRYQGTARSPSPELPEFDPRHIDQIALPVGMASLAATELQDGDLSDETVDQTPTVDTMLGTDDVEIIAKTLQAHLKDLATGEWSWLVELEELGCSWPEMAEFLLEKRNQSPWIYFDPWVTVRKTPHVEFHVKGCVHTVLENPHGAVARSTRESSIASVHTKGLRRTIASLCGMAGVVPNVPDKQKWNGAVEFADVSEARIGYQIGDEALSTILARVQDVIAGLCTALAVIQEAHGCCDRFSVLCRNSVRPQVELLSVHFEDIVTLHDALQIADSRDLPSLQDCAEASRVVMRSFYFPKAASPTTEQGALHFCALTAQFLCLGLVLYSYAHCGPLDLFFLERELSKVELLGLGRRAHNQIYIMARTERLTCLDAMLNSPVIVFSLSSIEGLTADRLDVLASVSEVVDAWGPATITKSSRNDQVASVDIRGGTLYALGSEKGHWASHETLNHDWWVANWDRRNKLLVGAFLQTNVVCAPSEAMCLQALQGNWLPLGTGKAYWRQQERELGLQSGQHLIVTANVVWDKVPGSSMKSRLLDDLKYKREYLAFLDTPCGLRVSFCSGLAKRVRMRDLLADLMPIYIERQLLEYKSSHHWQILSDDYQVMDKLVNDSVADCASMFRNMNRSHPDCFTTFWKFAFDIILALKPTGLHADGKCFTVALIPNDPSEVMRGVSFPAEKSNFWTRTLQDTPSCATFAYFTLDCLQLSGHGCRNTQQWCRNVLLLETEVRPQVSESSRLAASPAWTPEDGICHTFGDRDAETKATLRVRVVRSPSHADPQLIVQRSTLSPGDWKRFIERRKHGEHLQEKISQTDFAHRAFITSTNNTAFNFL